MIAVVDAKGRALRLVPETGRRVFGVHARFGFISVDAAVARARLDVRLGRTRAHGSPSGHAPTPWLCRVAIDDGVPQALDGCHIETEDGGYAIVSPRGRLRLVPQPPATAAELTPIVQDSRWPALSLAALIALLAIGGTTWGILTNFGGYQREKSLEELTAKQTTIVIPLVHVAPPPPPTVEPPPQPEPEKVKPAEVTPKKVVQKKSGTQSTNLGFLALLGKKTLKDATGGMPLPAEHVTAGAGAGGDQGSGGQLLQGLGQGLKKTTVGNTGTAGLGGIGNAGQGGGGGGFGNAYVGGGGSGKGRSLTDVRLADALELEGGLDRSVIQATIAKYLSQVRACYEKGLRGTPGLTGQVTMDFEIAATGSLNYAKVKVSSLGSPTVEGCISQVMLAWRFPKPVGGTLVRVNYPFTLKPASLL